MFIDFNRHKEILYINYYIDDLKVCLKTPIDSDDNSNPKLKIDKFDLTKYTYLVHFP